MCDACNEQFAVDTWGDGQPDGKSGLAAMNGNESREGKCTMMAKTIPDFQTTVEFDALLTSCTARALAKFPEARTRIERGAALVRADAVTDYTHITPYAFTVQSASDPEQRYSVASRSTTVCTCKDYERHLTTCKHGWAVLLTRAVRREVNKPRCRQAYHWYLGEGYAMERGSGLFEWRASGTAHGIMCKRDDVTLGAVEAPGVWR